MGRHGRHKVKLNMIVILLAASLIGFCVIHSMAEKNGTGSGSAVTDIMDGIAAEIGSADISGSVFDRIEAFFKDLFSDSFSGSGDQAKMDNALPVIGSGSGLEVHFIDVGQGKSILIKSGQKTALIDVGENGEGINVINYLKRQKIKTIDILIGTHPHSDHIGDMDEIIEEFEIGRIILPDIPDEIVPTTQTYTDLLLAIGKRGLKITIAEPGDRFTLGDAKLNILGPVEPYSDLNNLSVVTRLDFGSTAFLFTGDIEDKAEAGILNAGYQIKADVLDVAHHGSKTSSTKDFLAAVKPKIAVISCGIDNSYGHPAREAVERLEETGCQMLRTDLDGTVIIVSDGRDLEIHTQK